MVRAADGGPEALGYEVRYLPAPPTKGETSPFGRKPTSSTSVCKVHDHQSCSRLVTNWRTMGGRWTSLPPSAALQETSDCLLSPRVPEAEGAGRKQLAPLLAKRS